MVMDGSGTLGDYNWKFSSLEIWKLASLEIWSISQTEIQYLKARDSEKGIWNFCISVKSLYLLPAE